MPALSAFLVMTLAAAPGAQPEAPARPDRYPDFRQVVQDARDRVFPAVIYIKCIRESLEQGRQESQEVSGSGVIISPDGEALTNWHVVDRARSVRCLLSDGRDADAEVVGADKDTDLALIRLKAPGPLPYAQLGDSSVLREGDFVMAMGAPWGLNRSVSIGIVSCASRYLDGVSEYSLWLQTDAPINPGNSGGPLVNTQGEVIGLNARGMAAFAEGMGFAIPAETIGVLLPQLRAHGAVHWSWTGLQLQPLRDFNRDIYFDASEGVIIAATDPDSPARRAGLVARDRIVRVNGEAITARTEEELPAVRRRLGLLPLDRAAVLDVVRDGDPLSITLTPREKGRVEGEQLALDRFDITVRAINQFDNPDLFFHRPAGVFVYGLRVPGNGVSAGLARNDIIVRIDGREIASLDDVRAVHQELIDNLARRTRVVLVTLRNGLLRQVVLDYARDFSRQ